MKSISLTEMSIDEPKVISQNERSQQIFVPMGLPQKKDHIIQGESPILYHFLVDRVPSTSQWIIFDMTYNDIAGTNYKQRVMCMCDNYGIEIIPSLPEIVAVYNFSRHTNKKQNESE